MNEWDSAVPQLADTAGAAIAIACQALRSTAAAASAGGPCSCCLAQLTDRSAIAQALDILTPLGRGQALQVVGPQGSGKTQVGAWLCHGAALRSVLYSSHIARAWQAG